MKKLTIMVVGAFLLAMGTVYGQNNGCCGPCVIQQKAVSSNLSKSCPMKKGMSIKDCEKMMMNCPMLKGKSDAEKRQIIASCPMMKYLVAQNHKPLTKAEMAKLMANCPMLQGKTAATKKEILANCPMCQRMKMMQQSASVRKAQTNCPITGGKINKKFYVDVNGKRLYVCCPGCIAKIKADPDKYIKKLEQAGVKLEDTPKK